MSEIIVGETIYDTRMRMCALKFLESVSFNEVYIREVNKFQENKDRYKIFNLFKEIRNGVK